MASSFEVRSRKTCKISIYRCYYPFIGFMFFFCVSPPTSTHCFTCSFDLDVSFIVQNPCIKLVGIFIKTIETFLRNSHLFLIGIIKCGIRLSQHLLIFNSWKMYYNISTEISTAKANSYSFECRSSRIILLTFPAFIGGDSFSSSFTWITFNRCMTTFKPSHTFHDSSNPWQTFSNFGRISVGD